MIRLDKFFSKTGILTRSEADKAIKRGEVTVDGKVFKQPDLKIDEENAKIELNGELIHFQKYVYIMLNKPEGVVSATEDKKQKTVLDLLPEKYSKLGLFPCGRLDKDTLGLMLLTNDGKTAHNLLAPKKHVTKVYYFECAEELNKHNEHLIEGGIELRDGYKTKLCKIHMKEKTKGFIELTEGKYHEIKRMFGAVGNKIIHLKRVNFGPLQLDENLKLGEWRELTDDEQKSILKH